MIISCSKEDQEIHNISTLANSSNSIKFNLNNQKSIPDSLSAQIKFVPKSYSISGYDIHDFFKITMTQNQQTLINEDIKMDFFDFGGIQIDSSNAISISYTLKNQQYKIENIYVDSNNIGSISYNLVNGTDTAFINGSYEGANFYHNLTSLNNNHSYGPQPNDTYIWWVWFVRFLYLLGALVAAIIDAHCSEKIKKEVAACTANCQGAIVNSCGATCVDIPQCSE